MAFADVNGQRLYYEDTGSSGPVIVFSHGLLMDHEMFDAQVAAFRDRFRCITWDERGHGQTAAAEPVPFSYYDSADDLAALLTHLDIENAVLVGMSQGGFLSLRCALTHPERVTALVMLDSQAGREQEEKLPIYEQLINTFMTEGLTPDVGATIAGIILGRDYPESEYWQNKWKTVPSAHIGNNFQTLVNRDDLTGRLSEVTQPTLIIHGDADLAIPLERAQLMADQISDSVLTVIPGAGHAANMSHPDEVNSVLADFLNKRYPETV